MKNRNRLGGSQADMNKFAEMLQRFAQVDSTNESSTIQATPEQMRVKNAKLKSLMGSSTGQARIAERITEPAKTKRDYEGIARQFLVVKQFANGEKMYYNPDFEDVVAVKIGKDGTPFVIEVNSDQQEVTPIPIVSRPKMDYTQLYDNLFNSLQRLKDKTGQGQAQGEDAIIFTLLDTATTASGLVVPVDDFTKPQLAAGFKMIEDSRLAVKSVVLSTTAVQMMRGWDYNDLGVTYLDKINSTGYLGSFWGANFFVSTLIADNTIFVLTEPEYLGYLMLKADMQIIPNDDVDHLQFGFVGFQYAGFEIQNALGVAKVLINTT